VVSQITGIIVGYVLIVEKRRKIMITAEQFAAWKADPVTEEIYEKLSEIRDSFQEKLVEGQTLSMNADHTQALTHRLIGNIEGINQLLEIHYVNVSDESVESDVNDVSGY
jgi:uncharacterized phage-associated protein